MQERIHGLAIVAYRDALARDFHDLNAEWIERMFTLEPIDRDILEHPRERILDRGGTILFVAAEDLGIIGTGALMPVGDGSFELVKMAVSPAAQGRKAGEFLLAALLERAAERGIERLHLLTNRKCGPAIHLYEKLGFVHDEGIMRAYGGDYARCDVAMAYPPLETSSAQPK
jgi:GNAT superfamily N-acetyltransferase